MDDDGEATQVWVASTSDAARSRDRCCRMTRLNHAAPAPKRAVALRNDRGKEPGEQDYASQNPNDERTSDVAGDSPDDHYSMRARRRSSWTPRQQIIVPLLQSHSALTPPQSCDCVPSPRSVLSLACQGLLYGYRGRAQRIPQSKSCKERRTGSVTPLLRRRKIF